MARSTRRHQSFDSPPYLLVVNELIKDNGLEPTALGRLVAKVKKRLAASHVAIQHTLLSIHLPTMVISQVLRLTQNLHAVIVTTNATCR
jgi:hypothetical protein